MRARFPTAGLFAFFLLAAATGSTDAPDGGLRGAPEAVAVARQLVEQAGGAETWRKRRFEVTERIYPGSGIAAELRIVRDFERPARLLVRVNANGILTEWIAREGGWVQRDGQTTVMSSESLAAELQGLRQEPYAIYHRIARDDPALRVELRDEAMLHVYDADERLLAWFQVARNGVLLGWGNFFDGAVNQHWYGPTAKVGAARLPKFGVTSTGSYRFEYLSARFSDEPLEMPAGD